MCYLQKKNASWKYNTKVSHFCLESVFQTLHWRQLWSILVQRNSLSESITSKIPQIGQLDSIRFNHLQSLPIMCVHRTSCAASSPRNDPVSCRCVNRGQSGKRRRWTSLWTHTVVTLWCSWGIQCDPRATRLQICEVILAFVLMKQSPESPAVKARGNLPLTRPRWGVRMVNAPALVASLSHRSTPGSLGLGWIVVSRHHVD